jgi:hypothetical protein
VKKLFSLTQLIFSRADNGNENNWNYGYYGGLFKE